MGKDRYTNEIPVLEVEPIQLVARHLGIEHVLIDHECRSFGIIRDSLADLSRGLISIWVVLGLGGSPGPRTGWAQICQKDRKVPPV